VPPYGYAGDIILDITQLKRQAAERAVEQIQPCMVIGLGSGSTAIWALRRVAELFQAGTLRDIVCIPTSNIIEQEARALGIPLTTLDEHPVIDITIDGADEVDPQLNVIKGGGGALLREKIVAQSSKREIIVVDDSKLSEKLGTHWAVPVEVIPFGWRSQLAYLETLGAQPVLRERNGATFVTDQGNWILDCRFGPIAEVEQLGAHIKARTGIVEHGLFLGMASEVIVASPDGIRTMHK
jgi:ribose 5-phosphate isomerase A